MKNTIYVQLLILVFLIMLPSAATAQESSEDSNRFYEALIRAPILPQRDAEAIQSDLENKQRQITQSEKAITDAEAQVNEAKGWISTQKKEIDALKAKIKTAKKEKRDADKVIMEGQKKQLELVADYLKKTKEVRDSELDLAKSQKDLMNAEAEVYEAELDLRKKADSLMSSTPSDPNLPGLALEATQAAENTLMLIRAMADKDESVAGRIKKIAERRVDLVKARNRLLTEDRIRKAEQVYA